MCLDATGRASVESDKSSRILVANFSDKLVDLLTQKIIASGWTHRKNLVESHVSHYKILVLIPDDRDAKMIKRHVYVRDIEKINKELTDQLQKHMG